jgi:hypothetical protein
MLPAGLLTIVAGYYLPKMLQDPWFRCPNPEPFQMWPDQLECDLMPEFIEADFPVRWRLARLVHAVVFNSVCA